jgi:hypothetical protein
LIEERLLGKEGQECAQSGAVELGGLELDSGAEQSCAAKESNSLPLAFNSLPLAFSSLSLAFSSLSSSVSLSISFVRFSDSSARLLASSILLSTSGLRRQLSVDSHNRQRGKDEPDIPLLVELVPGCADGDVVIGAVESDQANHKAADDLEPALTIDAEQPAAALHGFWLNSKAQNGNRRGKPAFGITTSHGHETFDRPQF